MKPLPPFLRTTTFRITMLTTGLFTLSMVALFLFVFQSTAGAFSRQTDALLDQEISGLQASFQTRGINGINRAVVERSVADTAYLYLLTGPTGQRISGNLNALPADGLRQTGFFEFTYRLEEEDVDRRARARQETLINNYIILVATDIENQSRIASQISNAMWIGASFVLILGLFSGALISRRFIARIDALNQVTADVMAGDLKRRAPRNDSLDEIDDLSANLNQMLSRIESLMAASIYAGDSIAHDLRSPLTRLRARIEGALRQDEAKAHEVLENTLEDADELLGIFNSIQRISRLESGEQRSVFKVIDPAPILEDIAELYEPVCEEEAREFLAEIEPNLQIRADRGLLAQAVSNLVDNAIKYTDEGGAIALRMRKRSDNRVEISVTDTGPGVPLEKRQEVLKRFVRLEESRTRQGSGLGLALVKAVSEIHVAELVLEDGPGSHIGDGKGLRIALIFPKLRFRKKT